MVSLPLLHALGGRADLPIPVWLFGWGAGIVLVLSFVALASLWRRPRYEDVRPRPLDGPVSRALASRWAEGLAGLAGVFLLGVTVWAGLVGTDIVTDNFTPTFVFVIFWTGLVPLSILLGDVYRAFNPWRAIGRATGWLLSRGATGPPPEALPYPGRLGYLPAALGLIAFAWLELIARGGQTPRNLAAATLVYSGITFVGMALYGVEAWTARAESFSVYFGFFGRMAPFTRVDGRIAVRPFLSGLPSIERAPFLTLVLAAMLGTVTYDGFQEGSIWRDLAPSIQDGLDGAFGDEGARLFTEGLGLLGAIAVLWAFYQLGCVGIRRVTGGSARELADGFAHSLVPIASAYVLAHYATFLVFQGQGMGSLLSDPLGQGWDLFGTAHLGIDFGIINATQTWYLQVALVVVGHVGGLVLAHDRALARFRDGRAAWRSQLWMLGIMVAFTCFALWLLTQANR
ncbi:MAG: fenitrothion hydrolase [Thermoleophilia bacterium]